MPGGSGWPGVEAVAPVTVVITLVLGAVIGVLLGLLGGGGSILAVPALVYALGLGIEQAIPMSLIVVAVASAVLTNADRLFRRRRS